MFNFAADILRTELVVERLRYDALMLEYHKLVRTLASLKKKGHEEPHVLRPSRVIPGPPTAEENAARRMHDSLIESLAKDIENMPGVDPAAARAEAERLRKEALSGSVYEGPV